MENEQKAKDVVIDFIGGVNGGIATVYVGQSLDTVKVKMQTFPTLYRSSLHCFMDTFRKDGIRGLYAGTVPALAANIAENSVLFAAYGVCQKVVAYTTSEEDYTKMSPLKNATAGFLAAFFSSLTLCPTELVKCRLQAMREKFEMGETKINPREFGPVKMTAHIIRQDGLLGLFKGLGPTFGREMPGYFFFFGGYEMTRHLLTPAGGSKDDIGPVKTAIAGGIGGVSLWTMIFPFDVLKSRMQVSTEKSEPMVTMFTNIVRTEGIRALYKGLGPTILRTFPATGALFVAFEWTKKVLHSV